MLDFALGAALSAIATIAAAKMNKDTNDDSNVVQEQALANQNQVANDANDIAKQANEENLQFQKNKLDWDKYVQNQTWNREDTSYQRTVSDLRAAGLSPLAMNGTNGAGSVISTQAPQNDISSLLSAMNMKSNVYSNKAEFARDKAQREMQARQQFADNVSSSFDNAYKAKELQIMQEEHNKNMDYIDAQINSLNAGTEHTKQTTEQGEKLFDYQIRAMDTDYAKVNAEIDNLIKTGYGLDLSNVSGEINNSYLAREKESALRQAETNIENTLKDIALKTVEYAIKNNDLTYLERNGLSSYSSEWSNTMATLADMNPEICSKIQNNLISMLKGVLKNTLGIYKDSDVDKLTESIVTGSYDSSVSDTVINKSKERNNGFNWIDAYSPLNNYIPNPKK